MACWKQVLALFVAGALPAAAADPRRLDLHEAQVLAKVHSRALQDRDDELVAAAHRVASAQARFFPQLRVSARYSRVNYVEPAKLEIPISIPGRPPPEPITLGEAVENQYALRFYVEQPLFTGLTLTEGLNAARSGEDAARARRELDRADLEVAVEEAWVRAVESRGLLEVAQKSEEVLQAHLANTEARQRQGAATRWEVDRAQARLYAARAQKAQAQSAQRLSQLSLLLLTGLPEETELELLDTEEDPPSQAPSSPAELAQTALTQRQELAVARAHAEARSAQARMSYAAMWPQVRAQASYGWERPNPRYFPPEDQFETNWDASVLLNWTFIDFGATWHAAEAASADAAVAQRAVADLQEKIRLDVERRRAEWESAVPRLAAAQRAVSAAEGALTHAQALCDAGQAPCAQVLDAELEWTRARMDLVQTRGDLRLARVHLRRATGERTP